MSTLDIAQLALDVRATTTPDRLPALERFVTGSVVTRLADALAGFACEAVAGGDDAQIFIDHLDVDCSLASAWDAEALARSLAARVHEEIVRATRSGNCVVFRDRAELLAALIVALADGHAARRWWFGEFAGLALVPASNAIRTVVLDEGEAGVTALARLTERDARRIVGALAVGDAERVLQRIAARTTGAASPIDVLWRASAGLGPRDHDPCAWLLALIDAERRVEGSAGAGAIDVLDALRSLRTLSAAAPDALAEALASTDTVRALAACGVDVAGKRALDVQTVRTLCADLLGGPKAERVPSSPASHEAVDAVELATPHGGALLLRVVLARTDWLPPWLGVMPELDAVTQDVLAWMIATRAAAPCAWAALLEDAALRLLLPHAGAARATALIEHAALDDLLDAAAARLLGDLAQRLPGCDGASAPWLRANLLAFPARVRADGAGVEARIGTPPLDALLVIAGWKRSRCHLVDGRSLALREAGP